MIIIDILDLSHEGNHQILNFLYFAKFYVINSLATMKGRADQVRRAIKVANLAPTAEGITIKRRAETWNAEVESGKTHLSRELDI